MAVTKTGSTITIQSGDDGSQSVTVPTDADICVVMCSLYAGTPNWIVANPVTLAGTNLTTAEKTDNQTSNGHVWIGYIVSPSTGSQTLAWNFTVGTVNEGINFVVTFWTGVDTASPIVDSGKQTTSGADLTGLSADSGDMMVGCAYSYNSTHTSVTDNSQTELTRSTYNSAGLGAAYKDGGTGFYFTGGSYTTCAAIVIAAETTTEYDAAVSPLVVEATLTSTTATYASALSAAVSPVAVQATVVAVTATYAGVYSASVSPVAVQATHGYAPAGPAGSRPPGGCT